MAKDFKLERQTVSLFLQGREIKRYQVLPSTKVVIVPYQIENGEVAFIAEKTMREEFPWTYAYLLANKSDLEKRERGRMRDLNWYAYIYPKNLEIMGASKILVPDIAERASFALDEQGKYAFTSGYGITLRDDVAELSKYVLGLLNSRLLDFYLKSISTTIRGGFFRYFTQFIEKLPVRRIRFSEPDDKARHDKMASLVKRILDLHQQLAAAKNPNDKTRVEREIDVTDRQIDQIVYELYGLTQEEINVVEEATYSTK